MPCYIIAYDMAEGGSYKKELHQAIKDFGTWAHITESTWAVVTDWEAKDIRDDLEQYLPSDSRLFVIRSGTECAWRNVICKSQWLKKNL